MSDFPDDARVRITLDHPAGGQGHRIPQLDVTLTGEGGEYDGSTANAILDALPHTFVTVDDVTVEVVESGTRPEEQFASDAAEELAADHQLELEDLGDPSGATGYTKADVQAQIDSQSEDDSGDESEGD